MLPIGNGGACIAGGSAAWTMRSALGTRHLTLRRAEAGERHRVFDGRIVLMAVFMQDCLHIHEYCRRRETRAQRGIRRERPRLKA